MIKTFFECILGLAFTVAFVVSAAVVAAMFVLGPGGVMQ